MLKGKSRKVTEAELKTLLNGKPSTKKVERVLRSKHQIICHYVPTIGGITVKAKNGLFFRSKERALSAAKRSQKEIREKEGAWR